MSDAPPSRFGELCPFPSQTFSGQNSPCPVLSTAAKCPYADDCREEWNRSEHRATWRVNELFEVSYQGPVAVTLAEPSGSFVIRSEHHFHGKEMFRMSLRRHMYEVLAGGAVGPADRFPATDRCPELTPAMRLGIYIGYIDLRRHYRSSPLALGVLAIPRKLSIDPDAHIIVGHYGPLFGGPAVAGTIYSMQDDHTAGAACAQACIIMLLGMLSDRGAKLEGSYSLTQIGYSGEGKTPAGVRWDRDGARHLAVADQLENDDAVAYAFPPTEGLTPRRIEKVLRRHDINATAVQLLQYDKGIHDHNTFDNRIDVREVFEKLARRMIECHVQARYPVILAVNNQCWVHGKDLPAGTKYNPEAHAVTVVGVRKASIQNRQEQLIVHDPARQPYLECSTRFCFDACWAYDKDDPALVLVMPTEKEVTRSLDSCWAYLAEKDWGFLNLLIRGTSAHYPDSVYDYQFSLDYAKDVQTLLWPIPLNAADRADLDGQMGLDGRADGPKRRFWCLSGYENKQLWVTWFFPADGGPADGWAMRLWRNARGEFVWTTAGGRKKPLALPTKLRGFLNQQRSLG